MNPISKESLELAVRELAEASNSRIRALDVFFFYREDREKVESRAVSCSLGEDVYLEEGGYLNAFVEHYGTLARSDQARRSWGVIKSKEPPPPSLPTLSMHVRNFEWKDDFKAAKVDDITTFLGSHNFGRFYLLTTVPQYVHELQIYVSTFVVFADELTPAKVRDTWNILLWHLVTTLANPIIEELSKRNSFYHREWRLSTIRNQRVRHVMGNIPVKLTMCLLSDAVKTCDWTEAQSLIRALENQELLRDYAADVLYKEDMGPEKLLFVENAITTYTAIIELLAKTCEARDRLSIVGIQEAKASVANLITLDDLVHALTIVLNIWQNAWKVQRAQPKRGCVDVTFKRSKQGLTICIANDGAMASETLLSFNSKGNVLVDDGQGLRDILEAERVLSTVHVFGEVDAGRTQMYIRIHDPKR